MAYIITEPCVGVKDKTCVSVCPIACIVEGEDQLYINPETCIDCGACQEACPVNAIYDDYSVPDKYLSFIAKNKAFFGL